MFDFHEKRKMRSIFYSKTLILVLCMLTVLLSFSVYNRYVVAKEMQSKLETKKEELQKLDMRAQALESKVKYLENERGIEEELRNRFDVAREGEQVVVILNGEANNETGDVSGPQSTEVENPSFFDFLKFWER